MECYDSSATESFLLTSGIKGPQWIELKNVKVRTEKRSFCQHEYEVMDCRSIHVVDGLPLPSLKMMALNLATITQSFNNQTIITAACATIYEHVSCATTTPNFAKKPHHSASVGISHDFDKIVDISGIPISTPISVTIAKRSFDTTSDGE